MKRDLLTTTSLDRAYRPGGFNLTATPEQFRALGHPWSDIERWTMTGRVTWDLGERERHLEGGE